MLNRDEEQKILAGFEKNMKKARVVAGELVYPKGGDHFHNDENPLGKHRHFDDDEEDGAHTHTPQNPGGEHAHGENAGLALIDGAHRHEGLFGSGYHWHDQHEEKGGDIPITKVDEGSE